jgi:hypothetical protein
MIIKIEMMMMIEKMMMMMMMMMVVVVVMVMKMISRTLVTRNVFKECFL